MCWAVKPAVCSRDRALWGPPCWPQAGCPAAWVAAGSRRMHDAGCRRGLPHGVEGRRGPDPGPVPVLVRGPATPAALPEGRACQSLRYQCCKSCFSLPLTCLESQPHPPLASRPPQIDRSLERSPHPADGAPGAVRDVEPTLSVCSGRDGPRFLETPLPCLPPSWDTGQTQPEATEIVKFWFWLGERAGLLSTALGKQGSCLRQKRLRLGQRDAPQSPSCPRIQAHPRRLLSAP